MAKLDKEEVSRSVRIFRGHLEAVLEADGGHMSRQDVLKCLSVFPQKRNGNKIL
ncbi:Hypothetical protein FKW44_007745 [Caligus rogercresseyi]|uniref:Uncharacterized protein n=1 Tax=Caligus rogercresseyi TaxID=217165 RepID=A0A7T8QTT7_CALRO|nr:Hypothetical protein FKW44_007745 [Caligus rogercresseyi]